jgi:hypothetical protein
LVPGAVEPPARNMNRLSKQEGHISTCQLKREINDKEEEAVIHELHKPIKGMIEPGSLKECTKRV